MKYDCKNIEKNLGYQYIEISFGGVQFNSLLYYHFFCDSETEGNPYYGNFYLIPSLSIFYTVYFNLGKYASTIL